MLECLIGYIGIKACSQDIVPESGLYINQLAGINLDAVEKIADREQVTFAGVWRDIESRAIRKLQKDFTRAFKAKYSSLCCKDDCSIDDIICWLRDDLSDALLYLIGSELMVESLYSPRINIRTTINRESIAELRDFYQTEYENALTDVMKSIPKAMIDKCFECTGAQIMRVETLP